MNIMVVSDDHGIEGFKEAYAEAVKKYQSIDYVLHAGDTCGFDEKYYTSICNCPVYIVRGNNDYNDAPLERLIEFGGKKIFITHGHKYGVYMGVQNLAYAGMEKDADIIIFGHTHNAFYAKTEKIEVLNPGSLTLPRGGRNGSFAVICINDGEVKVDHIMIN